MKPAPDFSGTELRRPLVIVSWDRKCVLKKRQLCARKPLLCQIVVLLATFAHGSDSRQALQKAANLFQQGKLAEADQEATLALSDPQTRAAACSILGSIRFQQKRFPESADLFEKAIRLSRTWLARISAWQKFILLRESRNWRFRSTVTY